MCWDTNLLYLHYRIVENNKIMVGGQSYFSVYSPTFYTSPRVINKAIKTFKERFPSLKNLQFTHFWPGLIDVTKDLNPIVDYEPKNKSIQYALGCAGLPWAAYCGKFMAQRALGKNNPAVSDFLKMDREFFISDYLQRWIGKIASFSLSHLHSLK